MKRILFVDDEQRVLDGLRRMLRGQRDHWSMDFVDSGEAALKRLAEEPFDVIVTDMRMPGLDGAALLQRVRDLHPAVIRIVLSGHTELEAAMRAVPVAHQFLTKPCESDVIRGVVERATRLQEILTSDTLRATVGEVNSLPVLPRVYRELTAALGDPDVGLEDMAGIVEQDPGLCAKILQIVNSSWFGLAREISSVRHAVTMLGTEMLKNLVLSVEVFRQFDRSRGPVGFSIEAEQAHATLAARIAKRLLPERKPAEDAFMAALLHDIGRLVLAVHLAPLHGRLEQAARRDGRPRHEIERDLIGVTHGEIGAYLLGIWGMPYPIVEAVAHHHAPSATGAREFDVLGAVHVADALAHELDGDAAREGLLDRDYLEAAGASEWIERWREIAEEEAAASGRLRRAERERT